MSNTVKDNYGKTINVGDEVEVYKLTGCRDYKCNAKVTAIEDMCGMRMCWLDCGGGGHQPRALKKVGV